MTPAVENYVKDVLLASGVTSANISATTNGTHVPNSYHYDGQAKDGSVSSISAHYDRAGPANNQFADRSQRPNPTIYRKYTGE